MDENSFVVGYKSVPSFAASTGGYTLQGDYNANITCTVGEPEISYNSLTGVLTVTNIKPEVLGRVHYNSGMKPYSATANLTSDNLIVFLCIE